MENVVVQDPLSLTKVLLWFGPVCLACVKDLVLHESELSGEIGMCTPIAGL